MTDQFRALCANLTAALNDWQCETGDDRYEGLIDRARTALADEPAVPKGREPASVTGQPSDGEVAELTGQLIEAANGAAAMGWDQHARRILRAAELLQRLSPPQPVPVSERLPGPGDCDAEERCWLRGKVEGDWRLLNPNNSGVPQLKYCFSHWLPAHALPIPQQQQEDHL